MKSKTNYIVLILLLSWSIFFPATEYNSNVSTPIEQIKFLKPSAGYDRSFIHVDGNWTATTSYDWCYVENGHYIIENVTIDASSSPIGNGIFINNSKNIKFMIRNCTIFNAGYMFSESGIRLENTNNGTVINNYCYDNSQGIYVYNSVGNNFTDNILINNYFNGMYLKINCNWNNIIGNTMNNNLDHGILFESDFEYNNISLNIVNNNEDSGIHLNSFGSGSNDNIIQNNSVRENGDHGICIRNDNYNNSVINNAVSENINSGIYMQDCGDINVHGNNIRYNRRGLHLQNCENSNMTDNSVNNNQIGIYLFLNSDSNRIKNNTINQNDLGIMLDQSDFNNITGNFLIDNNWCIFETDSYGNIIEFNDCSTPTVTLPIFIDGTATGVGAHNWTWVEQQGWFGGGLGTKESPYMIENLRISGFGFSDFNGIEVRNSNVYFIIQGCEIFNSGSGILLQNVNNSLLIENSCYNNRNGISLEYGSCYNNITANNCYENNEGIDMYLNNFYNRIINNLLNYNRYYGIKLEDSCNHSVIFENSINYNTGYNTGTGIKLANCGYNTIIKNNASNNNQNGIHLDERCDYNVISNNCFDQNNYGIELLNSDFNNITDNSAYNNSYSGIEIETSCFNIIIENFVANNTEYGIYVEEYSYNNSLYRNIFLKNGIHGTDDGIDNNWNSTVIGNYWDNHTGPDTSPADGIVDNPYTFISGSAGSIDNLPIAEDGSPEITINSPSDNDVFGDNPPTFNVKITDNYLESMWYTLDGGLNNYTFTDNGTIDSSAWSAVLEGAITIDFYANDLFGHLGTAAVEIDKDTINPTIIINSPSPGSEFGDTAPTFEVIFSDTHLDSIWYSLDGGLTTYVISTNTTIDQTAWTALPEGSITITFYANDTAGNLSSEEVVISKSISPSGLDPTMIIIIIVVSIVGAVAIAGATYWYLKRNRKAE